VATLGAFQTITSALIVAAFFRSFGPLIVQGKWRARVLKIRWGTVCQAASTVSSRLSWVEWEGGMWGRVQSQGFVVEPTVVGVLGPICCPRAVW
jgi:hypothetical protein